MFISPLSHSNGINILEFFFLHSLLTLTLTNLWWWEVCLSPTDDLHSTASEIRSMDIIEDLIQHFLLPYTFLWFLFTMEWEVIEWEWETESFSILLLAVKTCKASQVHRNAIQSTWIGLWESDDEKKKNQSKYRRMKSSSSSTNLWDPHQSHHIFISSLLPHLSEQIWEQFFEYSKMFILRWEKKNCLQMSYFQLHISLLFSRLSHQRNNLFFF